MKLHSLEWIATAFICWQIFCLSNGLYVPFVACIIMVTLALVIYLAGVRRWRSYRWYKG